jgi:predicted MFS family arabinose efflux permease
LEEGVVGIYGSLRGLGAVAGAALAGYTAIHYSRTKTVIFSLSFLTLSAFLIMAIQGAWSAYLIGFIWGMAWSYQETIFVMLAMLLSERAMAATVFALLMMSSNIGIAIGEAMATPMALSVGFEPTFIALAIIGLCALVPVMLLMKLMPTK